MSMFVVRTLCHWAYLPVAFEVFIVRVEKGQSDDEIVAVLGYVFSRPVARMHAVEIASVKSACRLHAYAPHARVPGAAVVPNSSR